MKRMLVGLFGLALVLFMINSCQSKEQEVLEEQPSTMLKKGSMISKPKLNSYHDLAVSQLEQSDTKLGHRETEEVLKALEVAFDYIETVKDPEDIRPNTDSQVALTSQGMLQSLLYLEKLGYHFDKMSLVVYQSDSDNVYQFIFQTVAEGVEPMTYSGNYVVGTKQLEIVHQLGVVEKISDGHVHDDHTGHDH